MTSRSLGEPASGAKVSVVCRTVAILSISSFVKLSARMDGRERFIIFSFVQPSSLSVSSLIFE